MKIKRWDSLPIPITINDSNWQPVDITGCTLYFTVKKTVWWESNDDEAIIKKDVSTHTDPTQWLTIISLTSEDTDQQIWSYYREIQLKFANWDILSSQNGVLTIIQDITKRS